MDHALDVSFLFAVEIQSADNNEFASNSSHLKYTALHRQYTNGSKGFGVVNNIDQSVDEISKLGNENRDFDK